jgi:hypothetical protein
LTEEKLFDVPVDGKKAKKPAIRDSEKEIEEIIGCLTDPIITWPSPWMDTIPERVKEQIPIERMLMNMMYLHGKIPERTGTDAEALAYIYPRTLEAPLDRDWTDIYVYLGNQLAKSTGSEFPDDMKMDSLPAGLQRKLDHLKRWIYEKRVSARRERNGQARKEEKEKDKAEREAERAEMQPAMFDL